MSALLPAEWARQACVLLTWPREDGDFSGDYPAVEKNFVAIARAIARYQPVWINREREPEQLRQRLVAAGVQAERLKIFAVPSDDVWARDHGPITVVRDGKAVHLDFTFNGWGGKFQAGRDNRITRRLAALDAFRAPIETVDFVLEGGAIESDGEGTLLTTLQGVDDAAYVDFPVAQQVGAALRHGTAIQIASAAGGTPIAATVLAVDARVDPATRNALVRARVEDATRSPAPGASVRVAVPTGITRTAVTVPVSAVRKGPEGNHVFVLQPDKAGKLRAHLRRVDVGAMLGDDIVIENGLTRGERVAAAGSFKLREAVLVAVTNEPPGEPAGAAVAQTKS